MLSLLLYSHIMGVNVLINVLTNFFTVLMDFNALIAPLFPHMEANVLINDMTNLFTVTMDSNALVTPLWNSPYKVLLEFAVCLFKHLIFTISFSALVLLSFNSR